MHLILLAASTLVLLTNAIPSTTPIVQAKPAGPIITVDLAATKQTYDGIGFSGAFQMSKLLHGGGGLSTKMKNQALNLLFNKTTGAGFDILRNGLGSSLNDDEFGEMISYVGNHHNNTLNI